MVRVCVVGAGIVGLSTARVILETQPNTEVVVFADKFTPDTTSDVAAGIYKPEISFNGPTKEITEKWLKDALDYIEDMMNNHPDEAAEAGIVRRSGYLCATDMPELVQNDYMNRVLDVYRPCTDAELRQFCGDYKYGTYLSTYLIENTYYLPYLTKKITSLGGKVVKRTISSFEDLASECDVICNCAGLGARKLCKDYKMSPMRGQLFKVKAPWITKFVYLDYDTYIIPGIDYVTLGGTRQFASWNAEVDKHDSEAIWERCTKAIPSLMKAKVIKECVGWRPYRPVVRVEKETIGLPSGKVIKLVHNYGHGGYGVMSAAGTAIHAASLVQEFISTSSKL